MPKMKNPNKFVEGGTICFYWSGTKEEQTALKKKLHELALALAFKSRSAPQKHGRFVGVMEALATGELVIIPAEEYARLKALQIAEAASVTGAV